MSRPDVQERAGALRRDRVPFVHARVVRAERPTSAKAGDEALILADGTVEGFVGGTCAESTVRAQSLALLDSGETLLLRITPVEEPGDPDPPGTVTAYNPCLSGGVLEIFLEPVVPAPLVAVHGDTPIARAVLALSSPLGYHAAPFGTTTLDGAAAVVVASHGRGEEDVLAAALAAGVPYVGLVASRKRGESVLAALTLEDGGGADRARVHMPAGLDIGARTAEEVALSILAEIVACRPRPSGRPVAADAGVAGAAAPGTALDPVCGMTVATVETSLHLDDDGVRHWFCGSGCLRAFADAPTAYPVPVRHG
ncbi:MAG: xanthine dehydrogenase accessory factor [Actinomycetota bacterium]|jgi:xanthine dehydrogenase accessory factor|nr:xanthine dehydrogenase accessory factor [Actinomycetota bacterium]